MITIIYLIDTFRKKEELGNVSFWNFSEDKGDIIFLLFCCIFLDVSVYWMIDLFLGNHFLKP